MRRQSMSWQLHFAGSVPKDSAFPESNEDKLNISQHDRLYVMSDGASESFNSALWAEVLVESVCFDPPRTRFGQWLKRAISRYEENSDLTNLSWSQQAAFERGSFASLLVVELLRKRISITAIGDTTALLIENGEITKSFPYKDSVEFQQRPHLLSTFVNRHKTPFFRQVLRSLVNQEWYFSETVCNAYWQYPAAADSFVICVTDALGEWLLRRDNKSQGRIAAVLAVRTQEELAQLVTAARAEDGMRKDDSSLITLGDGNADSNS
jgi:hypothetical protein